MNKQEKTPTEESDSSVLRAMAAHNNLHSLLFNATSAEYYALTTQTYQLARRLLLERLGGGTFRRPAVVLDLDETVLDNSPYQAWLIAHGANFHENSSWRAWCSAGEADAVPGAVEFIRFAADRDVTLLFITSRQNVTREGTSRNLFKLGILSEQELDAEKTSLQGTNHALRTRLFMKGMDPVTVQRPHGPVEVPLGNKFLQRRFCEEVRGFEIALSIGDNLADYAEYYGSVLDELGASVSGAHPSVEARRQAVRQDSQLLGRDFVLLPNASYGGWMRAFEARGMGASDELAYIAEPVRGPLVEPQDEFRFGTAGSVKAKAPKFSKETLRIWSGPRTE